ncbi:hypothetical protein A0H81_09784 [Grifola frondosa]|uniref:Uncharacterized protein n=1 Tax=Grifola frondosa TaxID=5627 RepID=A0A1C7LZX0_GRIFR|nr:hypothetical protein A0H81_09784 [Grifola frondosa]
MSSPGPSYISSRSAEVILSDVRPIKLKFEALQSINVLLDELLYSILNVSHSLSTDKLKAGLIKVLPTSLGKEALLEAEVELKAYWERTTPPTPVSGADNGGQLFDLQWSFELLRLKCEAYSTMNDSDEDAEAEKRLHQRMEEAGTPFPPKATLLAPAALYLTAILECVYLILTPLCPLTHASILDLSASEHILSNVSRVAARDSSRTLATVQDLFVALCEDDSMYGMFKTMKGRSCCDCAASLVDDRYDLSPRTVYEQIEAMSKVQRPRRSKSFSRSSDKINAPSRSSTSSPHPDPASLRDSTSTPEDEELLQEFDELMRSGATMKVSLTPDRLKTMEVYKQERTERANRRPTITADKGSEGGVPATTSEPKHGVHSGRAALRHVDSIVEDEEETNNSTNPPPSSFQPPSGSRTRQTSLSSTSPTSASRPLKGRFRSISISNVPHPRHDDSVSRKSAKMQASPIRAVPISSSQSDGPRYSLPKHLSDQPSRTRKVGRNRESLDLDEVMAGEDGEDHADTVSRSSSATIRTKPKSPHISRAARDLIDFLDEGPPEEPKFPPVPSMNASVISFESSRNRSGRLQRMMSKLSIGGSRENLNGRGVSEEISKPTRSLSRKASNKATPPPLAYAQSSLSSKKSFPNVIIATPPPRPAPLVSNLISPPISTTSSSHTSTEDVSQPSSHPSHSLSTRRATRKAVPAFEDFPLPPPISPAETDSVKSLRNSSTRHLSNGHSSLLSPQSKVESGYISRSASRSPITPSDRTPARLPLAAADVDDLRRLLSSATNADECRLLVDMFLAKNGFPSKATTPSVDTTQLSPPENMEKSECINDSLERSIVALLLGGDHEDAEGASDNHSESPDTSPDTSLITPENSVLPLIEDKQRIEIPTSIVAE